MSFTYPRGEVADASLEEIVLDRPLHQVVVDGRLADTLVLLNRLVVVALDGGQIGDLEEVLVCETTRHPRSRWSVSSCLDHVHERGHSYASALSLSNHSAAFS